MAVVVYDVTSEAAGGALDVPTCVLTCSKPKSRPPATHPRAAPITDRQSFVNIQRWVEEVRGERGSDVIIVAVGNKTDLVEKRCVTELGRGVWSV